jgi:hercynylcysteine S-oxide lyase
MPNSKTGSFGTYPKAVRDQFRRLQDLAEASPDKFMRYQSSDHLLASRTAAANLLNVPLDTCVFLQNATLGINTVLRNLVYAPGDVIVYFDTIYGACEKTIVSILETTSNVRARKVDGYRFPCAHELVVERFVEVIEAIQAEGLTAKVAVFDTVCALPGVRFPFERLTEECRRRGILSCVDAAHGIGHIPLDLGKLDPDFLVSNCHK